MNNKKKKISFTDHILRFRDKSVPVAAFVMNFCLRLTILS